MTHATTARLLSAKIQCLLLGLIGLAIWAGAVQAQPGSEGLRDRSQWKMSVDAPQNVKPGDVLTLHFDTPIESGYHIYSVKPYPANKPGPTATQFKLDPESKDVQLAAPLAESGKLITEYDDVFELEVYHYGDKVRFSQKIKITGDKPYVAGVLKYQICNDNGCLYGQYDVEYRPQVRSAAPETAGETKPADSAAVSLTADTIKKEAAQLPPAEAAKTGGVEGAADDSTEEGKSDFWWTFIKAFLGGLASLITPCVFPMIPMTVSYFTKRSGSRAKGIRNAFTYAGSIILIFVVLGLLLTVTFGVETIYNLSTNPWMNLTLFAIVFIFGLSFLGWFELTLPSSWVTKMDRQSDRGGMAGIFFMALTLVLASFSCVGPIAGVILIDAAKGEMWGPTIGMLGYSMGFALPFGLFALFPQGLQSLPKSGGWLNSVKVMLGFLELALAFKFLSNSDLYWKAGLLDREVFLALWIVIFSLLGLYLLGKLRLPHDTALEKIPVPRVLLAIVSLSFVVYIIPGLWGAPLSKLSGLLPPPHREIGVRIAPVYAKKESGSVSSSVKTVCDLPRKYADKLSEKAPDGFCMFYDLEEAQAYAREAGKPLFIDFTGHTCANCRQMEHKVWPVEPVKKILTEEYVMVSLYVDENTPLPEMIQLPNGKKLRTVGDKLQEFQTSTYHIFAQPYYVLTDADLKLLVPEGVGYTPDANEYLEFLRKGLENFKAKQAGIQY